MYSISEKEAEKEFEIQKMENGMERERPKKKLSAEEKREGQELRRFMQIPWTFFSS